MEAKKSKAGNATSYWTHDWLVLVVLVHAANISDVTGGRMLLAESSLSVKGKCWGGKSTEDYMNGCPAAVCAYNKVRSEANAIAANHYGNTNTVKSSAPPCTGLP